MREIALLRPMLKSRLVDGGDPHEDGEAMPVATLDTRKAKDILGLSSFIGWRESVVDAVDSILEREVTWSV